MTGFYDFSADPVVDRAEREHEDSVCLCDDEGLCPACESEREAFAA